MSFDESVLLEIYDTILDPESWPIVLDKVAQMTGASGCIIFNLDEVNDGDANLSARHLSTNYDPVAIAEYLKSFAALETEDQAVFARHSAASDKIEAIPDDVLAASPARVAERANSQAMAKVGIVHRAGALLSKDQPLRDRFSIQFSRGHGPLGPSDRQILGQVLPHMAKACEISRPFRQLKLQTSLIAESLNRLRLGVCIIRHDQAVVALNSEFQRQLDEIGIFHLRPDGRLAPSASHDLAWFAGLTKDATQHGKYGSRPRKEALGAHSHTDRRLAVEVTPLKSQTSFGESRLDGYMVYSLDTSVPMSLDINIVTKVLELTGSESALIDLMSDGMTNRQISEVRDRSIDTVNTQVKGLLAKTNCANRTQLIRRVSNIGAHFLVSE